MEETIIDKLYTAFGNADLYDGDDSEAISIAKHYYPDLPDKEILRVFDDFIADNPE